METSPEFHYVGEELDLFKLAVNWKKHWGNHVRQFVRGRVLDVGAGQGNNLPVLLNAEVTEWTALEPDAKLLEGLKQQGPAGEDPRVRPVAGDTGMLLAQGQANSFDCVIYIDVMEHIEGDQEEMDRAVALTKPGGSVVILSPAFQTLYSEFDKGLGHFRRYTKKTLAALTKKDTTITRLHYLDSVGCALSLGNKLLLKQGLPTKKQIQFWDSWVIPVSRVFDPLLKPLLGRSVIGVWKKNSS